MISQIRCPICKREALWNGNPFRPFCSKQCKLIDLGSWIGGLYAIPGDEEKSPCLPDEHEEVAKGRTD